MQLTALKKFLPVRLLLLTGSGIVLALIVGFVPLFLGREFLTHGFFHLPTPLIFDLGVFIVVLGTTLISIIALRSDALREE